MFTGFERSDFFSDVESIADVTELDENDKETLNENEDGVEYKIIFRTKNKELLEEVRQFIEDRGGVETDD